MLPQIFNPDQIQEALVDLEGYSINLTMRFGKY